MNQSIEEDVWVAKSMLYPWKEIVDFIGEIPVGFKLVFHYPVFANSYEFFSLPFTI
jgi:hypothetical protein